MPVSSAHCGGAARFAVLPLVFAPMLAFADPDDLMAGGAEPFPLEGTVSGTLSPGGIPPVKFGVLGDYGVGGPALSSVATMIRNWQPDFVITTGDNNYGNLNVERDLDPDTEGLQCSWELNIGRYFGDYMLARADGKFLFQTSQTQRFFPCVGNHDSLLSNGYSDNAVGAAGPIADYIEYFHNNPGGAPRLPDDREAGHTAAVSYYAMRRGPVDLFFLDADLGYQFPPDPQGLIDQKGWLVERLAESTARWKVAVFHQPPATSSFRGDAPYMDWDELLGCDMVLCGHDHYYERLNFRAAVPLIISGAGGASLYGFAAEPHPASVLRYNARYSALQVTADTAALRVECRAAPGSPAESEQTIEAYTLGNPAASPDYEDEYSFFAEAGESITLITTTPGAQNQLDLVLRLLRPDGQAVLTLSNGMPDGRNVKLEYAVPVTGVWRVQARPESSKSGAYTLQMTSKGPMPDFSHWAQQLPPGKREPMDDPDEDGLPNLTEFGAGVDPLVHIAGGLVQAERDWDEMVVTFKLPSPLPRGIQVVLEDATDLSGPWQPAAWRTPLNDWTTRLPGVRMLVRNSPAGGMRIMEARFVGGSRRFVRLNFSLDR